MKTYQEKKPIIVNGRTYLVWGQFVEMKARWIGGILHDMDPLGGPEGIRTEITDITLEPNGKDSAMFSVEGKDFGCGFDVRYGGISGTENEPGWLMFSGYGGHRWRIKSVEKVRGS